MLAHVQGDLVRRARRLVRFYLRSELDDFLQETWYRLFQTAIRLCVAKKLRLDLGAETLTAYLCKIARNELQDQVRKAEKDRKRRLPSVLLETLIAADGFEEESLPPKCTRALMQLPLPDRLMLQLRLFDNRSYDEIAESLRISTSAAKGRFHRVIKRLREEVGDDL
jgi:RNA polymerase sigma factor (sigma-70 family)